jgi:glyoxylase-like metal-dependent hydrolase (beta-lactamase superfamily II)
MRFETRFFLAKIPSGQTPEVFENELENGVWGTPAEHLKKWYADDILISPPVLALLEKLNKSPASDWRLSSDKGLITQDEFVLDRVRFASWIQVVSVACPGPSLPQIGNVFLVGLSKFYLIDPGALDDLGVLAIQNAIQSRVNEGDSFYGILLTHHHPDHTNSANHFADLWDVPVLAHLATAEKLLNKIQVSQHLDDCDQIPLGFNPFTGSNLVLTAYHTPGHAPGHLVFFEAKTKTLFAGDLVSTSTTVLVSPPDGHLATYIHSINRMADFNPELLMPFHGCPSANGKGVLQTAVFHREKREAALLLALANNCHSLEALANEVYRGLPDPLMKLAQKQIHAGLIKLSEEGIVIAPLNNANEWKLAQ